MSKEEGTVRVFAMRPKGEKAWCYNEDLGVLYNFIEHGELFEVKVVEMPQLKFEALEEFVGW